jgi:hypothetical protein
MSRNCADSSVRSVEPWSSGERADTIKGGALGDGVESQVRSESATTHEMLYWSIAFTYRNELVSSRRYPVCIETLTTLISDRDP